VVLPDHPEVPPDNNLAERSLRLAVTKRKVGGVTLNGQVRQTADLLSVIQTCRRQGRSIIEFFKQALMAKSGRYPILLCCLNRPPESLLTRPLKSCRRFPDVSSPKLSTVLVIFALLSRLLQPTKYLSRQLYTQKYRPRGEMKIGSKSNSLNHLVTVLLTYVWGHPLWLWFHAYVLMNALVRTVFMTTELRSAQVGTIRTKLLKLARETDQCVRRVLVSISVVVPSRRFLATVTTAWWLSTPVDQHQLF